ncbi:MAG TPA: peptide chain release factor N(5)-glutamine methyltransferase [Gemmatales bacterium]|nr:peptide chain release factor N(5)-glutamine methyltransferase [Gemmatales bacterium]
MSAEPWTLGRLLTWTTNFLKDKQADSPRLDAEVLLAHILGVQRIALYTRFDELAGDEVRNRYRQLVKQRVEGCPVAYLVGFKEFYNLRFNVTPAVLIPRPETELLVLEAIRLAKPHPTPRIVDVGTGSGAVALTLAKHLPQARMTAIDLSAEALEVAKKNAEQLKLNSVRFLQGDLLQPVANEKFDLVVSNPPYIDSEVVKQLPITVKNFEPNLALDGGPGGTTIIERLAGEAKAVLETGGHLLLEIGADQGKSVPALLEQLGGYGPVTVLPDHAGLPRVVKAPRLS